MTPTIEEVKRVAEEHGLIKYQAFDFTKELWLLAFQSEEQLQAFYQHAYEEGRKAAYRSSTEATHECIYCYLRYTPEVGASEDCPNCGCDGTSEWAANAIRNNTGE